MPPSPKSYGFLPYTCIYATKSRNLPVECFELATEGYHERVGREPGQRGVKGLLLLGQ